MRAEDKVCVQAVRECLGLAPLLFHEDRPQRSRERVSTLTIAKRVKAHDPTCRIDIVRRRQGHTLVITRDGEKLLHHDAAAERTASLLRKVEKVWGRIW